SSVSQAELQSDRNGSALAWLASSVGGNTVSLFSVREAPKLSFCTSTVSGHGSSRSPSSHGWRSCFSPLQRGIFEGTAPAVVEARGGGVDVASDSAAPLSPAQSRARPCVVAHVHVLLQISEPSLSLMSETPTRRGVGNSAVFAFLLFLSAMSPTLDYDRFSGTSHANPIHGSHGCNYSFQRRPSIDGEALLPTGMKKAKEVCRGTEMPSANVGDYALQSSSPELGSAQTAGAPSEALKQVLSIIEKKVRNMEKRKSKLEDYKTRKSKGEHLNQDQLEALSKAQEVSHNLEFARELLKNFTSLNLEIQKAVKKAARREHLRREEEERRRLKAVLELQYVLDRLGEERVRQELRQVVGSSGDGPLLTEAELSGLDEFYKLVGPERDPSVRLTDQFEEASAHLWELLEGREKAVAGSTCELHPILHAVAQVLCALLEALCFISIVKAGEAEALGHAAVGHTDHGAVSAPPTKTRPTDAVFVDKATKETLDKILLSGYFDRTQTHQNGVCEDEEEEEEEEEVEPQAAPAKTVEVEVQPAEPVGPVTQEFTETIEVEATEFVNRQFIPEAAYTGTDKDQSGQWDVSAEVVSSLSQQPVPPPAVSPALVSSEARALNPVLPPPSSAADPLVRKQAVQDLMAQMQGTYNFMQDSMLEFDGQPLDPAIVSAQPMKSAQMVCAPAPTEPRLPQHSAVPVLAEPTQVSMVSPSDTYSSTPPIYQSHGSDARPPTEPMDPLQVSMALSSEPAPAPSSQPQGFQSVSKPLHSGINVNAAPFQSMQTVFNLNAPVPPSNEMDSQKLSSQYQSSYPQAFSTQPSHLVEQQELQQEALQSVVGVFHSQDQGISSSGGHQSMAQPPSGQASGFGRQAQSFYSSRAVPRAGPRGTRGTVNGYRGPSNGFRGGYDGYRPPFPNSPNSGYGQTQFSTPRDYSSPTYQRVSTLPLKDISKASREEAPRGLGEALEDVHTGRVEGWVSWLFSRAANPSPGPSGLLTNSHFTLPLFACGSLSSTPAVLVHVASKDTNIRGT
ncbi:hypothetical protein P4O66_006669, partial [Electrophorus voltai]